MSEQASRIDGGLWRSLALLLLAFIIAAAFLGTPAGAKLTGEADIRAELKRTREELARERHERLRLESEVRDPIKLLPVMRSDLDWMVKWIQAAEGKK